MTADRNFDRLVAAFMELGPLEAPDHVITAVVEAAERAPQVRRRAASGPWRILTARRTRLALGVAALLAVVVGAIYLVGSDQRIVPRPSPSEAPGPSGSTTPTVRPSAISSPIAAAHVVITDQFEFAWRPDPTSSTPNYEAIVTVRNDGPGWASLQALQGASYLGFDASGNPLSCVLYDPDFNVVADNTAPAGAEVILFEGWIANTRGQVVSFVNNVTWILTVDGQRADVPSNLTGVIRVGPTEWGDIFVIAGTPIGSGQTITTRYDLVLKSASFDGVFHYKKGSVYGGGVTCSVTGA